MISIVTWLLLHFYKQLLTFFISSNIRIEFYPQPQLRDCCIKFATGINMIIDIAQKVYKWSGCSFAKMVLSWDNHFGKRTTWLLIDILNYAFWYIYPSRKFDATVSMYRQTTFIFLSFFYFHHREKLQNTINTQAMSKCMNCK